MTAPWFPPHCHSRTQLLPHKPQRRTGTQYSRQTVGPRSRTSVQWRSCKPVEASHQFQLYRWQNFKSIQTCKTSSTSNERTGRPMLKCSQTNSAKKQSKCTDCMHYLPIWEQYTLITSTTLCPKPTSMPTPNSKPRQKGLLTQWTPRERETALARMRAPKISGSKSAGTGPAPKENAKTYLRIPQHRNLASHKTASARNYNPTFGFYVSQSKIVPGSPINIIKRHPLPLSLNKHQKC